MDEILLGEPFVIVFRQRPISCLPITARNRMIYRIDWPDAPMYLTKSRSQHGQIFWTAIPEDLKRQRLIRELGEKLEDQLIEQLCATTTASK
jgi:hypothetical protein